MNILIGCLYITFSLENFPYVLSSHGGHAQNVLLVGVVSLRKMEAEATDRHFQGIFLHSDFLLFSHGDGH